VGAKSNETYVIASSKIWDQSMPERLQTVVGAKFLQISKKAELSLQQLNSINPRYVFFPHWSYLIPPEIYENFECVVFHMTDLPYGRGGSPLQNLILSGRNETVVCAIKCVQEIDAGPIYTRRSLDLAGSAREIFLRSSNKIEEMIVEIINSNPLPIEQTGEVTQFVRRKPEESELLVGESLSQVYDFIRMLDAEGYPRAFINLGKLRIEFGDAKASADSVRAEVSITVRTTSESSQS
jgi:methionyl-tRNA formyltransferase